MAYGVPLDTLPALACSQPWGHPFQGPPRGHGHCCPARSRTLTNAATLRCPWRRETAMTRAASPDPPILAGSARVYSQQGSLMRCRCGLAPPITDSAPLASRHGEHSAGHAAHATHSPPNPSQPSPCRPASAAEQHTRNRALSTHPCQPMPSWPPLFHLMVPPLMRYPHTPTPQ